MESRWRSPFRRLPNGLLLPLVMLSSIDTNAAKAQELNFAAMLSKPVKQSYLQKTLVNVLAHEPVAAKR